MDPKTVNADKKLLVLTAVLIVSVLLAGIFWFAHIQMVAAGGAEDGNIAPGPVVRTDENVRQGIAVSHSPGFYRSGIMLEMYPPEGSEILYTVTLSSSRSFSDGRTAPTGEPYLFMGGKNPDPSDVYDEEQAKYDIPLFLSSGGRYRTYRYSQPVELYNPSNFTAMVVTVKAGIYTDGKLSGPVEYFTYVFGSTSGEKAFEDIFGSMLVVLTIDEDFLYDYETGIYINGKTYDEAVAAGTPLDPWTPRNYNQRGIGWERLAHADFFEKDGSLVLSSLCGVRIAGGTSRGAQIKSLKLISRTEYSGSDRFQYAFFENAKDQNGSRINSFEKLVLRNARNDIGGTMIRDQLLNKLGGLVGVDYQEGRNAVVYMNGKYYALMCLHESLDAEYMTDHYFVNKNNVASFLIKSDQYMFRYKQENGTQEHFECFISDMNYLIRNDFSGEDGYRLLSEVIDPENFCRYMAYQIYIVNEDWPHNNVLVWRYYGPENGSVKGMDGRWRFVLKDLDFGLVDPTIDSFSRCLNDTLYGGEPCIGTVLRNLLKNSQFRALFRKCCIEVTEVFTPSVLQELIDKSIAEISHDMELYSLYNGINIEGWLGYFDNWKDFSKRRNRIYLQLLDRYAPAE